MQHDVQSFSFLIHLKTQPTQGWNMFFKSKVTEHVMTRQLTEPYCFVLNEHSKGLQGPSWNLVRSTGPLWLQDDLWTALRIDQVKRIYTYTPQVKGQQPLWHQTFLSALPQNQNSGFYFFYLFFFKPWCYIFYNLGITKTKSHKIYPILTHTSCLWHLHFFLLWGQRKILF